MQRKEDFSFPLDFSPELIKYVEGELYLNVQFGPHAKHITQTSRLILFRAIISVHCENHTDPINAPCGQNGYI
jgi:hypothetical protein